ncbi:VWA domain-containing protein [Pseudochelatococcus sp. B33]
MTFIWMDMLWLLLLVPILIGLYVLMLRRRKRTALRYANLAMVKQALGRAPGWRRHLPPALLLIAIAVLILAVARPAAVVTLASSRATIILAVDVSGSMRAGDVAPSRIAAAQSAAKQFIADQPADVQIGIVAFASAAYLVQVPTIDREALYQAIDRFQTRYGTAVGSGVLTSLATIFPDEDFETGQNNPRLGVPMGDNRSRRSQSRSLDEQAAEEKPEHIPVEPGSYRNAVVILLSDGATTTGPDPIQAGQTAADYGVRVFTVGFGSPNGDVVEYEGRSMRTQPDIETLKTIARTTDAQFFEAQSSDDLAQVYKSLSARLISEKKLTEISFIFAGVGALFALLAGALSLLWFGRVV